MEIFGFIVSFLLVVGSSLLFTFSLKEKRVTHSVIYFVLILISQLIIAFELLSILKSIHPGGVLLSNMTLFAGSVVLWKKFNKHRPDVKMLKTNLSQGICALNSDKILLVVGILFLFCSLITLFFVIFVPTNSADALIYKLSRVAFWVQNNSLAYFETSTIRQAVFPINWELLLLWPMVFVKRDYFAVFPAFFSYLGCLGVVSIFLRNLRFSMRRTLWVVLIPGSLPIMILEASRYGLMIKSALSGHFTQTGIT